MSVALYFVVRRSCTIISAEPVVLANVEED